MSAREQASRKHRESPAAPQGSDGSLESKRLLIAQARHRIGDRGSYRLVAYGGERDQQYERSSEHENAWADLDTVGEAFKPALHGDISQRRGYDNSKADELQKVCREQSDDTRDGCAEHLADADFFRALLSRKRGEREETQTGDDDGEPGEDADEGSETFLSAVLGIKAFIEETE